MNEQVIIELIEIAAAHLKFAYLKLKESREDAVAAEEFFNDAKEAFSSLENNEGYEKTKIAFYDYGVVADKYESLLRDKAVVTMIINK